MQFFFELRWFSFSTEAIKIQDGLPAKSCDFEVVGMKPFNCTTRGFWVMLLLRPRLQGSEQIFERTKTCTDPPFVYMGPEQLLKYSTICPDPYKPEEGRKRMFSNTMMPYIIYYKHNVCSVRDATVLPFFSVFL